MQRRWANVSLVALAVLLALALIFHGEPWAPYLMGLALAGLAGGIADWYAVTAMFRHPLGLTWLPHTSIISANRDRIIDAMATLVETELLSTDFLNAHIQKISASELLMRQLQKPLSPDLGLFFSTTAAEWIRQIPEDRVTAFVQATAARQLEHVTVSDWAVTLIEWLIRSGNDRALFLFLSEHVETALDQVEMTEDLERRLKVMIDNYTKTGTQKFFLSLLESLGTVDYKELTSSIKDALKRWLHSDTAFEQFELALVRIMRSLRDDALVRARVEEAKMGLVSQIPWPAVTLWAKRQALEALEGGQVGDGLQRAMQSVGAWLEHEPSYQGQLDSLVKGLMMRTITQYHSVIGRLVRDNLRQMDEREWIDKLEFYVGRDLQWIRINGALVGALVGLLITVLTHL